MLSDVRPGETLRWQLAAINSSWRRSERLPFMCGFNTTPRKLRPVEMKFRLG
jgi:hypothetical protein